MKTQTDVDRWAERLNAEIEVAKKGGTADIIKFSLAHPLLTAIVLMWMGAGKIAKVIGWLLVCAAVIVGLKYIWLAVSWLWNAV